MLSPTQSAQRSEESPDVLHQEIWHLHRREVATTIELGPVLDLILRVEELSGHRVPAEDGEPGWNRPSLAPLLGPPLLLDDEEAVAIALALRTGARTSITGIEEAAMRALVKLQQMLPSRLQRRIAAVEAYVEPVPGRGPEVSIDLLVQIAVAGRNRETLRFRYQRHDETVGRRQVEPHRLVNDGRLWYLLGWDLDREDWRTFRVDRIAEARSRPGPRFPIRQMPDAARRVAEGAATAMWHYRARVIAHAPAEKLVARLPTAVVVEPVDEESCRLHVGSSTTEMLAAYLGLLGFDFTIEDPEQHPDLIAALADISGRLHRAARSVSVSSVSGQISSPL